MIDERRHLPVFVFAHLEPYGVNGRFFWSVARNRRATSCGREVRGDVHEGTFAEVEDSFRYPLLLDWIPAPDEHFARSSTCEKIDLFRIPFAWLL